MKHSKSGTSSRPLDVMKFTMAQPSLIEASAGTGKTYTITNLVVRALLGVGQKENNLERPLQIDEMLIVTFTNAATSDLRQRIYERIRYVRTCIEEFISFAMSHVNDTMAMRSQNLVKNSDQVAQQISRKAGALKKSGKGRSRGRAEPIRVKALAGTSLDGDEYEYLESVGSTSAGGIEIDEEAMALSQARNYSDEELQGILIEIRVAQALSSIGINDDIVTAIIENLLERNDTPLRQAALMLVRAERRINQAAICTIHSFCNSTLTQIYALESGEAFNTELKTDLADVEHEAWYNVWRRLFYRNDSSARLLEILDSACPEKLHENMRTLQSVRLSSESMGFYGFELSGFERMVKSCHFNLDTSKDPEPQLIAYLSEFEELYDRSDEVIIDCVRPFVSSFTMEKLSHYFDPVTFEQGEALIGSKFKLVKSGQDFVKNLAGTIADGTSLIALEGDRDLDDLRSDAQWKELVAKIVNSVNELMKVKATYEDICNKRSKEKDQNYIDIFLEFTSAVAFFQDEVRAAVAPYEAVRTSAPVMLRTMTAICMIREVDRLCKEQNVMSNDDVLRRLDHALNGRGAMGDRLAWAIRSRYPLAMIDEFQDTDPIQFNIFSRIYLNQKALDEGACCYLIGDPKQSIYAFRGSDINSYLKARSIIDELTSGRGIYTLDTNYRSSPDVVESSNAIFDSTINPANINPFDDSSIRFAPVKSGMANRLHARTRGKTADSSQLLQRDFFIASMDSYLADSQQYEAQAPAAQPDSQALSAQPDSQALSAQPDSQALSAQPDTQEGAAADEQAAVQGQSGSKEAAAQGRGAAADETDDKSGAVASAAHSVLTGLKFSGPANTYLVDVGSDYQSKAKITEAYCRSAAMLVRKILDDGRIVKNGVEIPVKSGDIAILVRKSDENASIQRALDALNIQSVYFSDQSSVLKNDSEVTPEARDMHYLMEAMCDCTSRDKVSRVLGSPLLSLTTEQFKERVSGDNFEKEVAILQSCARTWETYGFMTAFLQWANHDFHQVSARLLGQLGGERLYTNYCHVAEIIQSSHGHKVGIQSQLHWYAAMLERPVSEFDSDETRKRLESEQDQVRIMTIHKSKGLEFPVVIMPFLWVASSNSGRRGNSQSKMIKYYDAQDAEHMVLDFDPDRTVNLTRTLPVVDARPADTGRVMSVDLTSTPRDLSEDEDRRENTRLLYVALTRARYANFIFVGQQKSSQITSSLIKLQGSHELFNVVDESRDNMVCPSGKIVDPDYMLFLSSAAAMPEAFTILNGTALIEDYEKLAEELVPGSQSSQRSQDAAGQTAVSGQSTDSGQSAEYGCAAAAAAPGSQADAAPASGGRARAAASYGHNDDVPAGAGADDSADLAEAARKARLEAAQLDAISREGLSVAQSFLYRGAIDTSFNIASFSSLVKGVKSPSHPDGVDGSDEDRSDRASSDDTDSSAIARMAQYGDGEEFDDPRTILSGQLVSSGPAVTGPCVTVNRKSQAAAQLSPELSLSAQMNRQWQEGWYHNATNMYEYMKRDEPLYGKFPRGNSAGSFMHDVLEHVEFEKIREEGFQEHLTMDVVPDVVNSSRYSSVLHLLNHDSNALHRPLAEWFNDVVEAPVVQGRHHALALADLKPHSYEREMRFFMSNAMFQSSRVDALCRRVAADLLPHDLQHLKNGLRLSHSEIRGFITGSIDLACRFELNDRLQLRGRQDLALSMERSQADEITRALKASRSATFRGAKNISDCDPEMFADASFEQVRDSCLEQEGSCCRYYVIDYKSNYLGDHYEDYNSHNMISAVYKHRYDLQFMIYTLALYRHLKRRKAIPFDADYEQLREFYDANVGGVLYLFLRGMKANYLRDRISNGVFSTRLDFSVVYELDQMLRDSEQ